MDTRRISGAYATMPLRIDDDFATAVEIVDLTEPAVRGRGRGVLGRLVFVAGVALLAGLIAIAGVPSRSTFALDTPLPNLLGPAAAP